MISSWFSTSTSIFSLTSVPFSTTWKEKWSTLRRKMIISSKRNLNYFYFLPIVLDYISLNFSLFEGSINTALVVAVKSDQCFIKGIEFL